MKPFFETIPGVCEIWTFTGPDAPSGAPPDLLIETPHGATRRVHYDTLRERLRGPLPDELEAFFFVNTDVGSFEATRKVASRVLDRQPSRKITALRCLIPRTFIDCNRVVDPAVGRGGMTPALPDYLQHAGDRKLLRSLHDRYVETAAGLYRTVCGAGHVAVALHTYAPRSVDVELDADIVQGLRRAYAPERYASWPRRPDVDVISELSDGTQVAPRPIVEALKDGYSRIGIETAENATYRLHSSTLGHVYSVQYPGQILCVELNRELLADPFTPFEEMRIDEEKTNRMAGPLAAALQIQA